MNLLSQVLIPNSNSEITVGILISKTGVPFSTNKTGNALWRKTETVLIFGMLDTSQIVTPFNPLSLQNVAQNCDHTTFNVDCCYGILQYLLCICKSTKATVKFRAYITQYLQLTVIFYVCKLINEACLLCRFERSVVFWVEGKC
jgi:hypothetical protein